MPTEFSRLIDFIEQLRRRYMLALSAYKIFDNFGVLAADNILGEEAANKNVKTFNDFNYFFVTIKESCRVYLFIELAKFFDKHSKSLTLFQVLDYSKKNIVKLTKQDFVQYRQDKGMPLESLEEYEELSVDDIEKIKEKIQKEKRLIEKLKIYRDKYVAHDDIEKIKVSISKEETEIILDLIKYIIDFYFMRLDFSENSYHLFEEEPIREMNSLIRCLQEHKADSRKRLERDMLKKSPNQ